MTNRKLASLLLGAVLLLALGASRAAAANLAGSVANQPAATLLLPYFEVDLTAGADDDTIFSINNASASALLARATVWSDLAVPVFGFNVYLTGFDVQKISMRALLGGALPVTATDGQDPTDTISPQGRVSQDINFATCTGVLPPPPLGKAQVNGIRRALRGLSSGVLGGSYAGVNRGDMRARGFVTVDSVVACTVLDPGDPGYFAVADQRNILWGEFYYVGPSAAARPQHVGARMVSIRADAADPQNAAGEYTFYGREIGWDGSDRRQALGSGFAARYLKNKQLATGARLVVWRDSKVKQGPFTCGTYPAWYQAGLDMEEMVTFNEQEAVTALATAGAFPAATQRISVAALGTPYKAGWLYLDFDAPLVTSVPTEDPLAGQAWVFVIQDAVGGYSAAHPATMLQTATESTHFQLLP